jgi:hypothetical protein
MPVTCSTGNKSCPVCISTGHVKKIKLAIIFFEVNQSGLRITSCWQTYFSTISDSVKYNVLQGELHTEYSI